MPSPPPSTTPVAVPPRSPGSSSKKPASGSPKLSQAAEAAFRRTVESRAGLALNDGPTGPGRDGVSRLRGAYLIDLKKVRPDAKQPRREFSANKLKNLTDS